MRSSVLLAEDPAERERVHDDLAALASGGTASPFAVDAGRRALVAVLRAGDRDRLVRSLDRELLGLPRPGRAARMAV
jgi:hypothetical protein